MSLATLLLIDFLFEARLMKRPLGSAALLAIACGWAAIAGAANVNFTVAVGDFNDPGSWDGNAPGVDPADVHFIQNGRVANYTSGVVSMGELIVSNDTTPGTVEQTGGDLTVSKLELGRAANGDGTFNVSDAGILRTPGGDRGFVGNRSKGALNVGVGGQVLAPGSIWRIGNFGPDVNPNLAGEGLLNVDGGTFEARRLLLGVTDGEGTLRVAGAGTVTLSENLLPRVNPGRPNRSATVEMIGSQATLAALNLESANGVAENKNRYLFEADAGGVSAISLVDAANISNNRLDVDLSAYTPSVGDVLTLIDAAPDRIFGTFMEFNLLGADPAEWELVYDETATGDINLVYLVPEPTSLWLLVAGSVAARRRSARTSV